ncbi:MAG: 5-(carboxyamino)imidazole ribonucleotide mutase [Planctomycetia bacterium]|nr:5-(carboxyamino)imidazole ribonucleotide mutase [Planctomycetia bacterium]MBL6915766.1 5-(carboxyamino)imidazole ribonucleotide mutase [Planctomycetota bacterium]HCW45408.1 5-(carboxyamino)imidazole ribonucleotide mutase [Planctomycetota bacterium]
MSHKVLVVMGSDSDWSVMETCVDQLQKFEIEAEVRVCSAHRTPEVAHHLSSTAAAEGYVAIIAAAGHAAHLAGVMAASTTLPVIGVPIDSSALDGLDALLATVQMPPGVPVATVAIGKPGATNAAIFAAQIIGSSDVGMRARLDEHKATMASKVAAKDEALRGKVTGA